MKLGKMTEGIEEQMKLGKMTEGIEE